VDIAQYLQTLRRWWWLAALTTLAALLVAGVVAYRGATAYKATLKVVVSTPLPAWTTERPAPGPNGMPAAPFYDPYYYAWLASEYLADDLSEIVRSRAFAEDVGAVLGESVDPRAISEVVRTRKTHRVLTITVTANEFARAQRIGDGIVEALRTRSGKYLAQVADGQGQVEVIDPAQTQRGDGPAAVALDVALKTLLGLLLGLALIFAVDYLDPSVRDARDVKRTLELDVLAEIPRGTPRRRRAVAIGG
jgi:capsular polysaccharide biosynthesis protein